MPLSSPNLKIFNDKVASGVSEIFDTKTVAQARSDRILAALEKGAAATFFFAAKIFDVPLIRPGSTHVCRAIMCIKTINGTVSGGVTTKNIENEYTGILAQYRASDANKAAFRLQLANLIERLPEPTATAPVSITPPPLPVIRVTEIAPAPVVLPPRVEASFRKVLRTRYVRKHIAGSLEANLTAKSGEMTTASTRVIAEFSIVMHRGRDNLFNLGSQVEEAYANFSSAYSDTAKAENAKVELIKKIATAGLEKIPVVGGVLAGIAGGVISQFKHDEGLLRSEHDGFSGDESHLSAVSQFFSKVNKTVKEKTTLGVSADKMKPKGAFMDQLRSSYLDAETETLVQLRSYLDALFGDSKGAAAQNKMAVQRLVGVYSPSLSDVQILNQTTDQIKKDGETLSKALINQVNRYIIDNDGTRMKRFVELTMWSHYFRALVGESKFDAGFSQIKDISFTLPDPARKALERLQIVMPKGNLKYEAVVGRGRLPFDGHPVHNIGLILFFQWYHNVNPFQIFGSNTFTAALLESKINSYITEIGTAINNSKDRSFFSRRSDISDMSAIQRVQSDQMSKLRA